MEKSRLKRLVLEFDEAFSRNHKPPARCKLTETHIIFTGDAPPQKLRPRRVPPHWKREIQGSIGQEWTMSRELKPIGTSDTSGNEF